ncbi:hypothetical protein [Acuticoccus sp. I52.16.1]|uniref:hypothetical protein n=1 Tax=Acuticoccus sp. I52.16.1 TaxID=2928472 RepID=UPI001FD45048|nr:hypothetical protein [Acuticoccus sp. I52.16.1]UOM33705.1 hypothetical protein MRB58_17960 [Acuticoccus sp. I52.16.1]
MTKAMMAALLAATMGTGMAVAPATAQVSIEFGDNDRVRQDDARYDRRNDALQQREDQVEAEGDRRADYLRSKGNYRAAEDVEDRYDAKEDQIDDQQARNARHRDRNDAGDGLTIQLN